MTDWDPGEDAWLSGFADGEGSFIISLNTRRRHIHPRFTLGLRADDVEILRTLQQAFGGSISYDSRESSSGPRINDHPTFHWHVVGKRELAELVKYFDRFPLRAKKARDYAIWRQAVSIYIGSRGSGRDPRLSILRDALRSVRAFDADLPDIAEPFEVQLGLDIDE